MIGLAYPSAPSMVPSARPSPGGTIAAPEVQSEGHVCGPNCPRHFHSITRSPTEKGIDILA